MNGGIKRIEICGGIAAGKTTLARVLKTRQITPIYEDFKLNPFFLAFYEDPVGNAFEAELTFMLQHYHQQKIMANRMRSFFADFSMVLDDSYASVTLGRKERQLFRTIHAWIEQHLPTRTLLIRLECAPELELQRIRRRNRRAEKTITAEYLQRVNDAITANVKRLQRNEKVLVIDSGAINFARNPDAQVFVRRRVAEELNHA